LAEPGGYFPGYRPENQNDHYATFDSDPVEAGFFQTNPAKAHLTYQL